MSFKEFLDDTSAVDEETRQTLTILSEAHPVIRNHPAVSRLLSNPNAVISLTEVGRINQQIMQRTVQLAREAAVAPEKRQILILCEQNVLTTAASVLSAAISARLQTTIDKLSKITTTLRR